MFGVVTRDGLYTKSREEFDAKYSPVKKKTILGYLLQFLRLPLESRSHSHRATFLTTPS